MFFETLKKDYEFIGTITVNPDKEDDAIEVVHVSDKLAVNLPAIAERYTVNSLIEKCISELVYEPDRMFVFNATRRHIILDKLKSKSSYRFGFRACINGRLKTVRVSFMPGGHSEIGSAQFLIALQLVDEEEEDSEMFFIADSLLDDYEAIFLVETERNYIESVRINKKYNTSFERFPETREYSERIALTINGNIAPEDREMAIKTFAAENVMNCLEKEPVHCCSFRAIGKDGKKHYIEAKFARRYGPGKKGFVVGFRNIDEESIIYSCDYSMTLGLASDYDCVMYLNVEKGYEERILNVKEKFLEYLPEWIEKRTTMERGDYFIQNLVVEEDRKMVSENTDLNHILEMLRKQDTFSVNFRIRLDDEIRYYQLKFSADMNNGVARGIVVGFLDVNDAIRENYEKEAELADAKVRAENEIIRKTAELRERNKILARINDEIVEMLADVVEMRDSGGDEHIIKVKAFTNILAECVRKNLPEYALTDEDVELITSASVLHDIGKILIPDSVLLKPDKLTDDEFKVMQNHCNKGCDILMRASRSWGERYLKLALEICRYHHERWDGNGYPEGLTAEEIPVSAQIVSVADCYDALTSVRVYDDIHEAEDAIDMILRGECGEFSDKIMDCFRLCRGEFIEAVANPQNVIEK